MFAWISGFCKVLIPRANTGSWFYDVFYLILVAAFQFAILSSMPVFSYVDLVTPWITYYFIMAHPLRSLILGVLAALLMEHHSMVPAGLYLVAYFMVGMACWTLRQHLSLRNPIAWVVIFGISQLTLVFLEFLVAYVKTELVLPFPYILGGIVKIASCIGFGAMITWSFSFRTKERHPEARKSYS